MKSHEAADIKMRDSFGIRGEYVLHTIDFSRELRKCKHLLDRASADALIKGIKNPETFAHDLAIASGHLPACFNLEHRDGICPFGNLHPHETSQGTNTVVRSERQSITNQLTGISPAMNLLITQVACGTAADPTAQTMTQLVVETFRKAPSDRLMPSPESAQIYWNYTATEANAGVNLQEFAMVADGGTATPGSGSIIARFLQLFAKNAGNIGSGSYLQTLV